MNSQDLLVEIGTEELPPKSLFALAEALATGLAKRLDAAAIAHREVRWYATPRRLACVIDAVAESQPEQVITRTGPAVSAALDAAGQPTKAGLGFAASCGVAFESLERAAGPKGEVLMFKTTRPGASTATLLADFVTSALAELPIAKRMRWGAHEFDFVRPVHWIVLLFGETVVEARILGIQTGRHSRGHRFHAPAAISIRHPREYLSSLESSRVIADVNARRERIRAGVQSLAAASGGAAVIAPELLDEVSALVEWPVPLMGRFEARYLELPEEVPVATMQDHQRYFPVRGADGKLINAFITVANIESRDPERVRDGNERVIRPRLADAAFFWDTDRNHPLGNRRQALRSVTYQNKLGSVWDKSDRIAQLAVHIAELLGANREWANRAGELSKCDLVTTMVGEFPELQGLMGRYYAQHDGEPKEVASALEEQYLPRFSGDRLPETKTGIAVALADKIDTLSGIFAIGQKPSGTRDPFGLRRAALGVLRICLERELELDVDDLIERALRLQPVPASAEISADIRSYILERLRSMYLEAETGITTEMFDAVASVQSFSPTDIDRRLRALKHFLNLPEAASLASANKRIANILRKAGEETSPSVDTALLQHDAEQQLFQQVIAMERAVRPLLSQRDYPRVLSHLAGLKSDVDAFFDGVMVMVEDAQLRANRLGLLARLRGLFLHIADLSRLPG